MSSTSDPIPVAGVASPAFVISTREEMDAALLKMGKLKLQINQKTAQMQAETAPIETRFLRAILPKQEEYDALEEAVADFALLNRDDLLTGQKGQTLKRPGGELTFRAGRPSVKLTDTEDVVVERLRRAGLARFIRTAEAVDKSGLLREPQVADAVSGIEIVRPDATVTITPTPAL